MQTTANPPHRPPPCRSIFPYSAAQLSSNDAYKRLLADEHGELTVPQRLLSGACAGMTATALTHPLDTMRLRLALPNHGYRGGWVVVGGWVCCCGNTERTGLGGWAYGAGAGVEGLCRDDPSLPRSLLSRRCLPACLLCPASPRLAAGMADGFVTVVRMEGVVALYKGLVPTLVGIAPYAALNFASYDLLKRHIYNAGDKCAGVGVGWVGGWDVG